MKTKILSFVAIIAMTFATNAQRDLNSQPKPGPAPKVKLGKPEKFKLSNGLQVIMVENHKLPRVSASLSIDNKPYFEGNKAGVSGLLGGLLGNGTTSISKDDFNEKVDYLGANLGFSSSGAFASSLKKYFPEILGLMADGVKNPLFSKDEFDKEVERTLENLKNNEKNVTAIARRVESYLTYGKDHPFGEYTTPESIKNITLEDVKNNYNTYYRPNNAYLVVVGDINPRETKKLIKKLFSDWKKGTIPAYTMPKATNPNKTEINFINMPNAVQSEIAVVNNVDLTLGDKDYYAGLLANNILGGGGTARLFMNLREDKGYTYGSYSRLSQSRYAGTFRATASVRNTVTDSAVVELQKEIKKIRFEKVSVEELKNAKAKYVGDFVMDVQKPRTVANFALNIARYNLPDDFYENYLENINSVTLEDLQNAAQKYFKGDKARIFITGKGIDVLTNLEKTIDYEIKYFDKKGNPTSKPEMGKKIPTGVTKETVLNKYFDAIGGKDKVKGLNTTLLEYEADLGGRKIATTEKRNATYFGTKTTMNGTPVANVVVSKEALRMNGQTLPVPGMSEEMSVVLGALPEIGLLNNSEVELTGIENVDGKEAYVLSKKGKIVSFTFYFDTKTGLKIKELQNVAFGGRNQKQEATFSDYKDFNGVKFATKKIGSFGPQKATFMLKNAKVNKGVSDADFK
ncbi:insulinase family protein [Tenacibaculum jejuense]|uniref:Peptidase family M16 n=1 Tax=Tenacibaculum jejuense TaxID=584609 RepID=A0A238U985_9FLAO|nr:insulinase family protein [Tenacibaculum jejuense]SNR15615.1 Peptidase family M16 [Tenacibaculum jejuense]